MPTIKEIAKASGVSVATVSNIINEKGKVSEETRIRVQKIIEEMNYTPNSVAKNLKTKNSRCIGVIAELKARGIDRALEINQKAYDTYLGKN